MAKNDFICFQPAPQAAARLYCFPNAGGGPTVFRDWGAALAPDLEVWAVQLPGRGSRFREPAFLSSNPLVASLGDMDFSPDGQPFAFFGHSLGSRIAFEVTRFLRRQGNRLPDHLFVSASHAPQKPYPRPPVHALPHEELIAELRTWNGIPAEILDLPDVLDFFLPILRADMTVAETAVYQPEPPLDVPITAFGGREDPLVSEEMLAAWQQQTSRAFQVIMFPGDHFYFHNTAVAELFQTIRQTLRS